MTDPIWAEVALPEFPALDGDMKTDVLVIGGGLAGLLCARRLTDAGVDCVVIEGNRLLSGTSGKTTAKVTSQHGLIYHRLLREFDGDTAKAYWQANEEALARYRLLAGAIDCDFQEKANYIYSLDRPERLERELEALEALGIPAVFRGDLPLPFATAGAVGFAGQGQLHPGKLAAGLVKGLRIFEGTQALALEGRTVVTNRGRVRGEKIIVATHFPILNKHGAYFMKLYQQRSYVAAVEAGPQVDGMYLDERQGGLSFRNWGEYLLIGGGSHRTGKRGADWALLRDPRVKHRWAAQDCVSLDGMPYIGQYGRHTPGVYVATGFNKWGMTSAMAAARVLEELVLGREAPYGNIFDPSRRMLRKQLLVNGWESAVNLLTPTRPRCPHLGCALKWNPRERSWDCPCHGSRFAEEGELLENPATGGLDEKC